MSSGWATEWWFWAISAAVLLAATVFSGRYRVLAARARRSALKRGLTELPPGQEVADVAPGFWSDVSWLAILVGSWVVLSPWIWRYEQVDGAVATDTITGSVVVAITLAGIVFPALWALDLPAGLWLVTAPWLVGYGNANGPVGLSDSAAGTLVFAVTLASLTAAERGIVRGGGPKAIGRIRPRN